MIFEHDNVKFDKNIVIRCPLKPTAQPENMNDFNKDF